MVKGNSIASAVCEEYFFTFAISRDFGSPLFGVSSNAIRIGRLRIPLLLEEQLAGAMGGLYYGFD